MTNDLVLPFLNHDPIFAAGVEIGILYSRMKEEDEIKGYFQTENQEQITLMASRLGWHIRKMRIWKQGPEWVFIRMARRQEATV